MFKNFKIYLIFSLLLILFLNGNFVSGILFVDIPKFGGLMKNVTVTVGRDAILTCIVENLSTFKIAWLRVDTQTILTIQNHVITKNHRIAVTNSDQQVWKLHIKNVRISDRGWYMCQINTEPMKSQIAYVEVVAPPDILDYPTSSDMVVREGTNVSLQCAATGSPIPSVTWKKEDGSEIYLDQIPNRVLFVKNSILTLLKVDWRHSGIYLCIASNGVPPTVSKRISLIVQYAPKIHIRNQLVGASIGHSLTLECETEAYPKPIYYWRYENGQLLTDGTVRIHVIYIDPYNALGERYEILSRTYMYKIKMKLAIKHVTPVDFRDYFCVSKNPLGTSEGTVRIHSLDPEWIGKSTLIPFENFNKTLESGISSALLKLPIRRLIISCIIVGFFCSKKSTVS